MTFTLGDLEHLQTAFLQAIGSHPSATNDAAIQAAVMDLLVDSDKGRDTVSERLLGSLELYRISYFSRFSQTLASTLFERLGNLVGVEAVLASLCDFALEDSPACASIVQAAKAYPSALERMQLGRSHPFLPDLARVCLAHWHVLTGPDPHPLEFPSKVHSQGSEPDLGQFFLQSNRALICSSWPVFDLWCLAENPVPDSVRRTLNASQAQNAVAQNEVAQSGGFQCMLLFKSEPWQLEILNVPEPLGQFTTLLHQGHSVAMATEEGTDHEGLTPALFGSFLSALSERKALVVG